MVGRLVSFWEGPFSGAMLVLGRVTVLVPWVHPWDLSVESRSVALGFKHFQTPSGLMPRGMYSEQYSAAPSGRGPKQRGRKSMIVSLGEMETQAESLATRDGINLTRTVAKKCMFFTHLHQIYTRSNWSCFSLPHFLDVYGRLQPWKYNPPWTKQRSKTWWRLFWMTQSKSETLRNLLRVNLFTHRIVNHLF